MELWHLPFGWYSETWVKDSLKYTYTMTSVDVYESMYITKSLPARCKCVLCIFLTIFSVICLYCAKPHHLKIHRMLRSFFAFCDVIGGKDNHAIHNIMHLAITRSITDLRTIPPHNLSNCKSESEMFRYCFEKKGCEEGMWSFCYLAYAPSYGKGHNVVYCCAYFGLQWHHRRPRMIIIMCIFRRRRLEQ